MTTDTVGEARWPDSRWTTVVVLAGLAATWEILVRLGPLPSFYFPPPSAVAGSLVELTRGGELLEHGGTTLVRIGAGLLVGASTGFLAGVAMGRSERLRVVADPVVGALYPLPKIAILPLVMIFLGIGESSKHVVIALAAFFPMLISTLAGVRQIPDIYFEVAENYGADRRALLRRVVLPASLPAVLGGLRIALNSVIHVTIAVEIVSAVRGLGALIWLSWEVLRVERLYAALVLIALLGIAATWGVEWMSRRFVPWRT
ncbi:MAG: ABC transporter permease [Gemmatimonadota bacterium]|nr:ABC transporter permease [Gemmatimonadota bacterium]